MVRLQGYQVKVKKPSFLHKELTVQRNQHDSDELSAERAEYVIDGDTYVLIGRSSRKNGVCSLR